MIKMTMFLKRHPNLTHEEFVAHHIQKHGPLFKSIPEAKEHVLRYIQTHPIREKTSILTVNDYDGTAEIWFDSLAGLEAVLTSATYKAKVFPDEVTFLDHEHTLITIGEQVQIIGDAEKRFMGESGNRSSSLIQRLIDPKEIADFATYVSSPLASAINGAALRVDGGLVRSVF